LLGGSCASVFTLVVDPVPVEDKPSLCAGAHAGFIAARTDEAGERLSLAVFAAEADPSAGADPCQVLSFVRSP
jgi:hypothetical protein